VLLDYSFGHVDNVAMAGDEITVQDMHGDHHLPGGLILSDEVGMIKGLQGIEVVLLGDAEESIP
jgi:hypothetical protein